MRRMFEVLRVLCDMSFWHTFIAADMREETRMMHEEAEMAKGKIGG